MNYSAIILCAGSGKRSGLNYNKMLYKKDGTTVYEKTVTVFLKDPRCTEIIIVTKDEERQDFQDLIQDERLTFVSGGKERQDSVYNGLSVVTNNYVMIHDGARPYLKQASLDALCECLETHDACLLMVPAKDTIKRVINGKIVETLKREELMQAQTPQAFKTKTILKAHEICRAQNAVVTDDASMVEIIGEEVYVVMGDYENIKITTPEDLI